MLATKKFIRGFGVDIRRAVLSSGFLLTVLMLLLWMFLNCGHNQVGIRLENLGAAVLLDYATSTSLGISPLVFAIATVTYSGSFLVDRESGFEDQAVQRLGVTAYGLSKVLAVALSAFLAAVCAMGLYTAGVCIAGAPLYTPGMDVGGYTVLAANGHPAAFFLLRFLNTGLSCAFAAVFSLMVTAFIPNSYVGLLCPLVGYYMYMALLRIVYELLNYPAFIAYVNLDYIVFSGVPGDAAFSAVWAIAYLLTATALCGRCFLRRLRKERGL